MGGVMNNIMEANAMEIHTIEFLAGLDARLVCGQEVLKECLKTIPNGWRDYRMLLTRTEKLLDSVYSTLPNKTRLHMQRLCEVGEIIIRPKPAVLVSKGWIRWTTEKNCLRK